MKPERRSEPKLVTVPMANKLINILMQDRPCWRVTRVLGSMLVFDFGDRIDAVTKRGNLIQVGSEQLSIRNVHWLASSGRLRRWTSDTLDGPRMDEMCREFSGSYLKGCHRKGQRLSLVFSHGLKISLDLTNRYGVESAEEIAEFRLKGSLALSLSPGGAFTLRESTVLRERKAAA